MRHAAVFVACLCVLFASSYAATIVVTGLLSYNGMVIQSNGNGNQVTLATINSCDKSQQWALDSDGYIFQLSNNTLVLDVQNSNTQNGNPTIMWNKKPGNAPNQLWTVNTTTNTVQTQLNGFYLRKSSASNGIVTSNNSPPQNFAFITNPYPCPDTCTSHGDPHFTSWNNVRFDFQSANTVLLANWSGNRLYTVQFSCAPGVTCNEGFVMHPAGTNDTFQLTGTTLAYYNKQQTTVGLGTTSFGSFFNVTKTSSTVFSVALPGAVISYGAYKWQYGWYINIGITLNQVASIGASLCTGPAPGQNAHAFGSQFLVTTSNGTAYQYAVTPYSYNPNYVPNYGPFTTNNTDLINRTTAACSVITAIPGLGSCNALIPPAFYLASCYNDSYALNNVAVTQMSVDTYSALCSQAAAANGTNITLPTSAIATVLVGVVTTISSGATTTFTIIAKNINSMNRSIGGDSFTIIATGPSSITFNWTDNGDGTYTVTYSALVEGSYTISVKLSNISDVSGSPFNVTVLAVTSAVTSSVVLGPVPVGQQSSFTIQARTASGANRSQGGDTFTVTAVTGSFSFSPIIDNGDGTYTVNYIPYSTGTFTINVVFQGSSIQCSPYTVIVR